MEHLNNDFEQLLKQQTDSYKMYPAPNVWNNINHELHGKQRITIGTITVMFILMLLLTIGNNTTTFNNTTTASNELTTAYIENVVNATSEEPNYETNKELENRNPFPQNDLTTENFKKNVTINQSNNTNKILRNTEITNYTNKAKVAKVNTNIKNLAPLNTIETEAEIATTNFTETAYNNKKTNASKTIETTVTTETSALSNNHIETVYLNKDEQLDVLNNEKLIVETSTTKNNEKPKMDIAKINIPKVPKNNTSLKINIPKIKSRIQFHIAPGISYRILEDNRENNSPTIPLALSSSLSGSELDKSVTHKPAAGYEMGVSLIKKINRTFNFRTGLQLNYNKYNIKVSYIQPEIATIALNTRSASQQINNVTNLRTNIGIFPKWLENSNLQVSVPIGLDVILAGSHKVQIGMATALQPSYLLRNKMLMLSTDLKNYTSAPSLINRFNLNSSFETFVAISGKKLRYQVGPQIRYQMLSTYNKEYPIKEKLFDYGLKFGVSKVF